MSFEKHASSFGKLDVSIPESIYEAGKSSTVSIIIRNPFDTPVEIIDIQGPKSPHLHQVSKKNELIGEKNNTPAVQNSFTKILQQIVISEVSFGGVRFDFPKSNITINIKAEEKSTVEFDKPINNFETINIHAEKDAIVKIMPDAAQKITEDHPKIIESHCEIVAYFDVSTAGWLFFTPTRQNLNTQITYKISGVEKTQVVSSGFDIKPPLKSMIIGSIIGGVLGNLAKIFNATAFPSWNILALSIGASVLMSLIATISLSRKTGSQGFITVEDFFGGFVIGALIGYGGHEYFEKSIIPNTEPK